MFENCLPDSDEKIIRLSCSRFSDMRRVVHKILFDFVSSVQEGIADIRLYNPKNWREVEYEYGGFYHESRPNSYRHTKTESSTPIRDFHELTKSQNFGRMRSDDYKQEAS